MDARTRQKLIEQHQEAIHALEREPLTEADAGSSWPPSQFYLLWHVVVGMALGGVASLVSLGANAIGAPLFGRRPMELIRVFLTFPMGERALTVDEGSVLTVGCVLFLATGAIFGVLIHLVLTVYFSEASVGKRFLIATALGLGLWIVNFYLVLSWLQPLLLGGNWVVRLIPLWVGALTHLAFAWTVAAGQIWGRFEPYRGSAG
ncbi:MAG: hypothetical protein KDD47_28945 [Acidobacteria bacterium]|nr:hypothetical protein [Acidobacteriota bacterium]